MIFVPLLRDFNLSLLRDSTILGVIVFSRFACQTIGLETISANRASFFFGLSVVFVTIFEVLFRKRISVRAILASGLAFSGMAIMSWEGGEPLIGDLGLLASAFFDTVNIILLERFAHRHSSISLTGMRIWIIAILGLLWAAPDINGQLEAIPKSWGVLLYLSVVATAILFFLYTIALRFVPAYEAALFGALEPVFGAIIAFFILGETFGTRGFIGAAMVLSGMLLVVSRPTVDQTTTELTSTINAENLAIFAPNVEEKLE